jgi:hypothetical protein
MPARVNVEQIHVEVMLHCLHGTFGYGLRCLETIFKGAGMNRWLRYLSVCVALLGSSVSVWSQECESEIQNYAITSAANQNQTTAQSLQDIRNRIIPYFLKQINEMPVEYAAQKINELQELIASRRSERDNAGRNVVAGSELELCFMKNRKFKATNSGGQSSPTNKQSQQSPQPYIPGTSTLDRYLTAPKEDCDAIPQSYNVSDRQFAVSQCRLRNANRDKYAANANAASAQPATNEQSAQQKAQQAQQQAQQNQARADQARQGKRRRHEPENEASHCIQPDFGGLFGGMKNTCNFKVWYTYCGYRPKESSWLTGMNCEKQSFGSDSVSPGRTSASHTKGVEMLYWLACKEPAWTVDAEFVPGQGLRGRCYTVGGN